MVDTFIDALEEKRITKGTACLLYINEADDITDSIFGENVQHVEIEVLDIINYEDSYEDIVTVVKFRILTGVFAGKIEWRAYDSSCSEFDNIDVVKIFGKAKQYTPICS